MRCQAWERLPEAAELDSGSVVLAGRFLGWEVAGGAVFVRGVDDLGLPVLYVGRLERP